MNTLEELAKQPPPSVDEVAGRWAMQAHGHLTEPNEYGRIIEELRFGKDFSNYTAHSIWTRATGQGEKAVKPYGPLPVTPETAVLRYGQEISEGSKVYRREDDLIWTFHPGLSTHRFNQSA